MIDAADQLNEALRGRYTLQRVLGRGGMATVYYAEDLKHQRPVAIKVLDPELAATIGHDRFLREIQVTARLQHPHILPLYDSGEAGGLLYYVMPFVEGESLRERLRREPQLPIEEATRLGRETAEALDYAHRQGIVHRDVKPENILLSQGHALVADFGIARAVSLAGDASLTRSGIRVGTPLYMSPEQTTGTQDLDGRSDQYSLACVVYEMVAGQPPFVGPNAEGVAYQHLSAVPAPVTSLRTATPAPMAAALERALSKTRTDRFPNASEFGDALVTMSETAVQRRPGLGRRHVMAAVVVVLVLAGLAMAFFGRGWKPGGSAGTPTIRSLAVLPLVNLSGDREQEYFADGMTEELIANLAKIGSLRVISRTSVMVYKSGRKPLPEIARELGVDAVVEGSVIRAGDRIRITAELLQANPERHLWGDRYERQLRDVLTLQSEVAQAIASEIHVKLTPDEHSRLVKVARAINPEAHEAYLRGRFYLNTRDSVALQTATKLFETAIRIDSSHAPAWAGLADAYYWQSNTYLPPRLAMPRARAAALKAITLDPDLGAPYATLGIMHAFYDWDWPAGRRDLQRVIALDPSYAEAHLFYGFVLSAVGELDSALAEMNRARELDPLSINMAFWAARASLLAGRNEEGIARLKGVLTMDPNYAGAYQAMGMHYLFQKDFDLAFPNLRRGVDLAGDTYPLACLGYAYAFAGQQDEARAILRRLTAMSKTAHVPSYSLAMVHAALGETDRAMEWLEKAYQNRDEDLVFLNVDPAMKPLRASPRFQELLRRLNLAS